MSPGMWVALYNARNNDLMLLDAMQARISSTVAATVPRKNKRKIKESDFRFLKPSSRRTTNADLLTKMKMATSHMRKEIRG